MKRFYSLLILCLGVLSSLMAHDAEVNGIYYNLDATNKTAEVTYKGDNYRDYEEYSGSVNIPEKITFNDVTYKVLSIGQSAFVDCGNLTSVTVPNSVTTIRSWAFGTNRGQTATAPVSLQYLTLGSGITTIENNAFYNARGCFEDCIINYKGTADSWAKINFENSSANPVREANKLYINGELLTEVEITSATSIAGGAFYGCADITSVKLGNIVEEIGAAAFSGCTGITSVTLPKSVKTIGANAFENCTGLKTLQIGSGVTSIGAKAFNGCSSLKSVTSYATTVPAVSTNSFSNFIAYLYVPCASKIDYDLDATFGQFKYIECVTEDEGGDDNGNDNTGGDNTGGDDEGGDDNGNDNTGGDDTGDDNTGGDDDGGEVTPPTPTPTVFDTTTDQGVAFVVNPNSANPVFVPLTYSYIAEYQTAQYKGTYTVTDLDFTAKIGGLTNLDVINYGTNGQALAPKYVYNPTRGASNGFTITGDYKVGDILNINAIFGSDWYVTLIIDVIKTLEPTPNDITLYYVNSNKWAAVNGYVWPTGGTGLLEWPGAPATKIDKTVDGNEIYSYSFDATKANNIIFNNGLGNQTSDLAVNASKPYYYDGVWYETLTFDGAGGDEGGNEGGGDTPVVPDPTPEPEGLAFFVAGNGGSDATGIWCNGIEWSSVGVETANNMTDADKDGIYEITFNQVPAGTWNFKVVGVTEGNMSWMGSDFLDTTNSSAGYTTAPYDGNIGFTLTQAADVTVKFNTATGKIILTTPSGSFGKVKIDYFAVANTDECYVENIFEANNNTLKYTENIQILEGNEYGYAVYRILGNCNYAVYENSLLVEVTESGIYDITIVFNGDYENPDFTVTAVKQGGTIDPDPVVAIKNLMLQPFEQVLPNTTTTTVATFTLQNANTATVSIEGLDADFFEIGEQNIGNGECSVSIVFKPIVRGVYYATLVVTTDDEVSLSIDFAAAAGDETFEPGDVPELNPDPVNPGTPDDEVSVEEVSAIMIYAKEGTIYSEVEFEIYDLAGVNVTKLNGSLQGVYIVKTAEGNRLVSVW